MHVLKRIATIVVRSSRPAGMEPSEGAASTIGAEDDEFLQGTTYVEHPDNHPLSSYRTGQAASTIGASDHRRFAPIRKYTRMRTNGTQTDVATHETQTDVATQTSPRSSPVRVGNKKIMHILQGCDEGFDTRHSMPEIIQLLEQDGLCYRVSLPPELVGIHPATRAAHDFSSESVHWIGSDLVLSLIHI